MYLAVLLSRSYSLIQSSRSNVCYMEVSGTKGIILRVGALLKNFTGSEAMENRWNIGHPIGMAVEIRAKATDRAAVPGRRRAPVRRRPRFSRAISYRRRNPDEPRRLNDGWETRFTLDHRSRAPEGDRR